MSSKLTITKADLNDEGYYAKSDSLKFDGSIEIEANLGWVRFKGSVVAKLRINAGAGSGIEAGEGIEAGSGIEAGWGIEAGSGIKAGWGIEAGEGIEAGWGIEAGSGIEAGEGIEAGFSIICQKTIAATLRIFAGLWNRRAIKPDEMEVRCDRLVSGTIAYGTLIESAKTDAPAGAAE